MWSIYGIEQSQSLCLTLWAIRQSMWWAKSSKLDNLTQKRRALHDGSVDRRLHREQDSIFDES